MIKHKTIIIQLGILIGCIVLIIHWALRFPYPCAVVKPFLPPEQRWPEAEIRSWIQSGNIDQGFWKFFTRDPERIIPSGNNIVAPADGTFQRLDYHEGRLFVVIGMSFWDVHVQRFPCDGIVTSIEDAGDTFMDGEGRDLAYIRDKISPVQKIVTLNTEWGEFKIRQITSIAARRIEVWVNEGDQVSKGQRLGVVLAGSTVVLEMPDNFNILPTVGSQLVAGETILWTKAQ